MRFNLTDKPKINKQETPVAAKILEEKAGTPTMAGIIIWLPPLLLAFLFFNFEKFFS